MAAGLALAVALPARAQMFNQIGNNGRAAKPPPAAAPPPALPGAGSSGGGAAPLTRVPADMEPNDALFDAINRGDIATARDALSRGADLHAHNILGMTPLELSIDLGHNDISFMLLSMRAADEARPSQPKQARAARPEPKQPVRQSKRAPSRAVAASPTATQTARLFSGDGGTPNPNAGFLGFDSSRR
jgi:ankyrin repeat protein